MLASTLLSFWLEISLLAASPSECTSLPCFLVSTGMDSLWQYASAAEAFAAATAGVKSEIDVLSGNNCADLSEFWVENDVEIRASCLRMTGTITVCIEGHLLVEGAALEQSSESVGFTIEGKLELRNCTLSAWHNSAFKVQKGWLSVQSSLFRELTHQIISLFEASRIDISDTVFRDNSAGIIATSQSAVPSSNITVSKCVFVNNSNSVLFKVVFAEFEAAGRILISESDFENNTALLFDLQLELTSLQIDSCEFRGNSAGGLLLRQQSSDTQLTNCSWISNDFAFVQISLLIGTLLVENCFFSDQKATASIQVDNSGDPNSCRVMINASRFVDSLVLPAIFTAAALYVRQCTAILSNSLLNNCTATSPLFSDAFSAVLAYYGNLEIFNTTLRASGGSTSVLVFLLSTGVLSDVKVLCADLHCDEVVLAMGSVIQAQGMEISTIGFSDLNVVKSLSRIFIFLEVSSLRLSEFSLENSFPKGNTVICSYYSNSTASNLRISNISSIYLFSQTESEFFLSNLSCDNCLVDFFSGSSGASSTTFTNITLIRSVISSSLIISGSGNSVFLNAATLFSVKASSVAQGGSCRIEITDLKIVDSRVDELLSNFIRSVSVLKSVRYQNTTGALMQACSSDISLSDSHFDAVTTEGFVVVMHSSHLVINQTRFDYVASAGFAYLMHDSDVDLIAITIPRIDSSGLEIFKVRTGSISFTKAKISDFNATLLSCDSAKVTISSSIFRNGGFGSSTTNGPLTLLGGVLRCSDCPHVSITQVQFSSTSAQLGGALYLESVDHPSSLSISDSEFRNCTASSGGAIFLSNVSFAIENDSFVGCTAEVYGGALDAEVRENSSSVIAQSHFTANSAHEGGAIKWRNAALNFISSSFDSNVAVYGPDLASYGVNLSVALIGDVAPGQPLQLTYSLLDHYGQVVLTANSEMLVLEPSELLQYRGITSKIATNGTFNFTGISALTTPGNTTSLSASYRNWKIGQVVSFQRSVQVQFRDCVPGEVRKNDSCVYCESGYFSVLPNEPMCRLCPDTALCPGGAELIAKENAWLTGIPSNPILSCPILGTCTGGTNNSCSEGYDYQLCSHCSPDWFPVTFFNCSKCPPHAVIWLELAAFLAVFTLILWGFHSYSIVSPTPGRLLTLKVLLSHVQYLAVLALVKKRYSTSMEAFLRAMLTIGSLHTASFPFACLGKQYYFNVGLAAASWIEALGLSICVIYVRRLMQKSEFGVCGELWRMAVLVSPQVVVAVVLATLPLFSCTQIGDDKFRLVIDMSEKCWSGAHLSTIHLAVLPAFLLNFLCPLLGTVLSCAKRGKLPSTYTSHAWELVFLAFKLMCASAVALQISATPLSQVFLGALSLYFLPVVNAGFQIYEKCAHVWLTEISFFVLIGSYSLVMYSVERPSTGEEAAVSAIFIVGNSGFFLLCITQLFSAQPRSARYQIPSFSSHNFSGELLPPNTSLAPHSIELEMSNPPLAVLT